MRRSRTRDLASTALDRFAALTHRMAARIRDGRPGPRHRVVAEDDAPPDTTNASVMFRWCLAHGLQTRPQYLWSILLGTRIAAALDIPRISAIEFGVAGGNGLIALEKAAATATSLTGVQVDVYGFDTGQGMPDPVDHRDVPWVIQPGYFSMDEAALRDRLMRAQLVLGPVAETVPVWRAAEHAPIGFISFDLDYYSATMQAFGVLEGPPLGVLPRLPCYFDDVFGYGWSDFNGERAAIADFNANSPHRKIGKIHGLRFELPLSEFMLPWHEKLYLVHTFDHPLYNACEGKVADAWFEAHRLQPEG